MDSLRKWVSESYHVNLVILVRAFNLLSKQRAGRGRLQTRPSLEKLAAVRLPLQNKAVVGHGLEPHSVRDNSR